MKHCLQCPSNKKPFRTLEESLEKAKELNGYKVNLGEPQTRGYQCPNCGFFHVGRINSRGFWRNIAAGGK